jgi:hypothetical protein
MIIGTMAMYRYSSIIVTRMIIAQKVPKITKIMVTNKTEIMEVIITTIIATIFLQLQC